MKKVIIATAILVTLTAGLLTATTKNNEVKIAKVSKTEVAFNNNIVATAD